MNDNEDYYDVLQVNMDATSAQLKYAYRQLCFKYHPDRNTNTSKKQCEKKLQRIIKAYKVLSDPQSRALYDNIIANKHKRRRYDDNVMPMKKRRKRGYRQPLHVKIDNFLSQYSSQQRKILVLIVLVLGFHLFLNILSIILR